MNKPTVTLTTGNALRPIYPQSLEEAYRIAKMAMQGGVLVPLKTGYGDNAVTEDPEATLARGTMLILQGMEVGVPPMQAVQLLAMIKGRITAHSEAVPGILLAHGCKIETWWTGTEMSDDWTCHKKLTRPNGDVYEGSYSVKDAKQAGLWDQNATKPGFQGRPAKPNDSAWFRNPKRMLNARALGNVGKDGASDFLKGIAVREEIEDIDRQIRDVTPPRPVLDIPEDADVIDPPAPEPASQEEPDVINAAEYLRRLQDERDLCNSEEDLQDLRDANAASLAALKPRDRKKAEAILKSED